MAGNLGFTTYVVGDATATFDLRGPDGTLYPAETVHGVIARQPARGIRHRG